MKPEETLRAIEKRIAETVESRTALLKQIESLEAGYVKGSVDASDVLDRRKEIGAVDSLLQSLREQAERLSAEIHNTKAVDRHFELKNRAALLATRIDGALIEFRSERATAAAQVEAIGHQMASFRISINKMRREFLDILAEINESEHITAEILGVSGEAFRSSGEQTFRLETVPLDENFRLIESASLAAIERKAEKERKANLAIGRTA